jgi:hypothetical protein
MVNYVQRLIRQYESVPGPRECIDRHGPSSDRSSQTHDKRARPQAMAKLTNVRRISNGVSIAAKLLTIRIILHEQSGAWPE